MWDMTHSYETWLVHMRHAELFSKWIWRAVFDVYSLNFLIWFSSSRKISLLLDWLTIRNDYVQLWLTFEIFYLQQRRDRAVGKNGQKWIRWPHKNEYTYKMTIPVFSWLVRIFTFSGAKVVRLVEILNSQLATSLTIDKMTTSDFWEILLASAQRWRSYEPQSRLRNSESQLPNRATMTI